MKGEQYITLHNKKPLNTFWEILKDNIFILFRHPDDFIMERNRMEERWYLSFSLDISLPVFESFAIHTLTLRL